MRTWFDVDRFRGADRLVVARNVDRTVLVLGSTQGETVVDLKRASEARVRVMRRRSGGGAVLLVPGAQLWADMWVPRSDPLWHGDPRRFALQVGEWWASALYRRGIPSSVHQTGSVPALGSDAACFAGIGPGEVSVAGRKLIGLAQWRSKQGALVHGCAYRRFDPKALVALLNLGPGVGSAVEDALRAHVVDLETLGIASFGLEDLRSALPGEQDWEFVIA